MTYGADFDIIRTMEVKDVAANLDKHEAVCAERWKTAFNKFEDMESSINRIESILIAVSGTIIVGGAGLIIGFFNFHGV